MNESNITMIGKALVGIKDNFKGNELAYLSLTSKNEGLIRDSFCMNYYHEEKILGREYKRIDAVSFLEGDVKEIFEFTSMYTANLVNDEQFKKSYLPKILKDFKKNNEFKQKNTDEYIILISTHPKEQINKSYSKYVKYISGLNTATKKWMDDPSDSSQMIQEAHNTLRKHFIESKYYLNRFEINAGREFDCDVDIIFWVLYKKYCLCDYENLIDILLGNNECNHCRGFLKEGMNS